jgi:hypothetical protein
LVIDEIRNTKDENNFVFRYSFDCGGLVFAATTLNKLEGSSSIELKDKNRKNPLVLSGLLLCRFAARNLSDLTDRETWDGMNLAVLASTIGYILL